MLWKILTESWDCETPHPPTRWDKIPTFSENLKWEAPLFILSKTINAEKVLNLKSSHDEIFGFCLTHCDCGRGNVYFFYFFVFLFLVFVFIAFQKVHMLTNSGYCPRLVVAAVGSLLLATAPTWSIASTPQCNEWNMTRCSDDDDYDHLNIFKTISLSIRSRSNPTHELE